MNIDHLKREVLKAKSKDARKRALDQLVFTLTETPKTQAPNLPEPPTRLYSVRQVAQMLGFVGIGQNKLFKILREQNVLSTNNNQPYQSYISRGWFLLEETRWSNPNDPDHPDFTLKTCVTKTGVQGIKRLLIDLGYTQFD